MTDDSAPTSALGSDSWLGADEYESGSALHTRATNFLSTVKWDVLADIASKHRGGMSCQYEDKFSVGHFNMVRRIVFEDGENWVARVRLPNENMFAGREELEDSKTMEIEVASMKFFRSVSLFLDLTTREHVHLIRSLGVKPLSPFQKSSTIIPLGRTMPALRIS